jgi:hypothetical protein
MDPMRILFALVVLLVLPSSAAGAPVPQGGFAAVRLTACTTAEEQAERSAVFEGEMRAVRGTMRLQMRFTLQARTPVQKGWARVAAPKLDTWVSAHPGKRGYVYVKRVDNLLAPADYRTVVRFRWLDADGDVVASAKRVSRTCHQPDPRPDLRLGKVRVRPGAEAGLRRYALVVLNAGETAAGPFAVAFTAPGAPQQRSAITGLAAGARTVVEFEAKACEPGSALEIAIDADDQVEEAFEQDDLVTLSCPE